MTSQPFILVGIPAFNEEGRIAKVVLQAEKFASEVIVCDDGSGDMTADIARAVGARVIVHERNQGYGAALSSLFVEAAKRSPDVFVTVDGDGQHDPAEIPALTDPILKGEADVVVGSRFLSEADKTSVPAYRQAGIKVITDVANRASHGNITDAQSGFRAYNLKALISIRPSEMGMGASTEILMKADDKGLRVIEVPTHITYDDDSSTSNPVYHGVDVIFSTIKHLSIRHPLLSYGVPGFSLLVVALGFWIWAFQIFEAAGRIVTNITLLALGASIIGAILLMTGVILWVLISMMKGDYK